MLGPRSGRGDRGAGEGEGNSLLMECHGERHWASAGVMTLAVDEKLSATRMTRLPLHEYFFSLFASVVFSLCFTTDYLL